MACRQMEVPYQADEQADLVLATAVATSAATTTAASASATTTSAAASDRVLKGESC